MKIPVIVVDDQEVDRYLVKRSLSKVEHFGELTEVTSGSRFLDQFFSDETACKTFDDVPLLVLMDINMPGLDGFQTIEEAQRRMVNGSGPSDMIVMMFTSSDNQQDREKAEMLNIVKGYLSKPVDDDSIQQMLSLYYSLAA